jgi:hypothetical protein
MKTFRESVNDILGSKTRPVTDADLCACGFYTRGLNAVKGSFWMELLLWLMFFPIGIIYSIWRLTGRTTRCPKCGIPIPR